MGQRRIQAQVEGQAVLEVVEVGFQMVVQVILQQPLLPKAIMEPVEVLVLEEAVAVLVELVLELQVVLDWLILFPVYQ